jgi:hypothetical protein
MVKIRKSWMAAAAALALSVGWGVAVASAKPVQVYVLAGQSNAVGVGTTAADLPAYLRQPQKDVLYQYTTSDQNYQPITSGGQLTTLRPVGGGDRFYGPEITLGRAVADRCNNDVAIVKFAYRGTTLFQRPGMDWNVNSRGELYDRMLAEIDSAFANIRARGDEPILSGLAWMQGESDAKTVGSDAPPQPLAAESYQGNLSDLIGDLRARYDRPNLRVALGMVSLEPSNHYGEFGAGDTIRAAQRALAQADRLITVVRTDDLLQPDGLHYAPQAYQTLGYRMGADLAVLMNIPEPTGVGAVLMALAAMRRRRRSA